jgi:hypothetical protein
VLKGVIGVLAAVVGVLAFTAAVKENVEPARNAAEKYMSGS